MIKQKIILIISLFSLIVFITFYLFYDSKMFGYGLNCDFCKNELPYNLKPYDDPNSSFTIINEDDFELIGKGFQYKETDFKIKKVLAYGYNDTSVVIVCTDSIDTIKYLISYETEYKNERGSIEVSFRGLSVEKFQVVRDQYNWFNVNEDEGQIIEKKRFLSMIGIMISLIFIIWGIFKKKR